MNYFLSAIFTFISPQTRSLRVHRTGVVSKRLALQAIVVHTEQLVTETCHCDLSPSVSRPLKFRCLQLASRVANAQK